MTTEFTMFVTNMTGEKGIPFEVSIDPFYSSSNMEYLEKITSDIDSGKVKVTEHQLIEEE